MSDKTPQESGKLWTVRMVLSWTQQRFNERGIPSSRLDAELLLAHALGRSRISLYTGLEQPLTTEELTRYRTLIQRRLGGEPVAYLIGRKDFWTLTLAVNAAVLIPRPETETLVEVALALLPGPAETSTAPAIEVLPQAGVAEPGHGELTVHYEAEEPAAEPPAEGVVVPPPVAAVAAEPVPAAEPETAPEAGIEPRVRIADIGVGSGAVALALKKERPAAEVFGVDCSRAALEVAAQNGESLGLAVTWLEGDLTAPLQGRGPFDLVVSNPPYIASADIPGLAAEVRSEPLLALDGGPDGLRLVRRLVVEALPLLAPGGALALEIGDGQAADTAKLLRDAGYVQVAIEEDLARVPRVVSGRRAG